MSRRVSPDKAVAMIKVRVGYVYISGLRWDGLSLHALSSTTLFTNLEPGRKKLKAGIIELCTNIWYYQCSLSHDNLSRNV